ncbi:MAG: hypothetical protein CL840_15420 [Crocinitomicaceae bacterium]|nr:hypothetical protein [Crocinitomicaceae bacterium]|tara:strand:+ start:2371 stop:3036 length:666 start_codon:yes stop_codon:yes gene_type:complete
MIDVSLFGGLITISQREQELQTNIERYAITSDDPTDLERQWNARIDELQSNITRTYFHCSIDVVKRGIENFFANTDKETFNNHPKIGYFLFEFESRSGEFELDGKVHGLIEANGQVNVTIADQEELVYKSLLDFYEHYFHGIKTTYHYAHVIGLWDDSDNLNINETFKDGHAQRIRSANPVRSSHCFDKFWSDRVEVMTPCTYAQRYKPIMVNGLLIKAEY